METVTCYPSKIKCSYEEAVKRVTNCDDEYFDNGSVACYGHLDTSFTRCVAMIQKGEWTGDKFHQELMRCSISNVRVLSKTKDYYRRLYGQE